MNTRLIRRVPSLLACVASVSAHDVDVHYGELREPGQWGGLQLE